MDRTTHDREILEAVKRDDVKLFGSLIEAGDNKTLRYGKFPLLSVCYLFGSGRIIAQYEKMLLDVRSYRKTFDDPEIYKRFRRYRKRCFRVYLSSDSVISPLEILYITGNREHFTKVYPYAYKNESVTKNLKKLHRIQTGCDLEYKKDIPVIPRAPMSRFVKTFAALAIVVSLIGCLFSVGVGVYGGREIYGSKDAPYILRSARQFEQAMEMGDKYFRLGADITLETGAGYDFTGHLDGDGYTVTLVGGKSLFNEIKGELSDLNVVIEDFAGRIESDTGFLALINSGTVSNVNIKADLNIEAAGKAGQTLYIGTAFGENKGNITDLTGEINAVISGEAKSDTMFAGLVAINSGTIDGIATTDHSSITSTDADVAGIVAVNNSTRSISGAINGSDVRQTTESPQWSPNVGGITLRNNGTIENSRNQGSLYGSSTAGASDSGVSQIIVGGIAAVNNGSIKKCANEGAMEISSSVSYIQAGGIAAQCSGTGAIENCYSKGELKAAAEGEEAFVFLGGIIGNNEGSIAENYSISPLDAVGGNERTYAGGIIGVCNVIVINGGKLTDNYYLKADNISLGTGGIGVYYGGSYVISPGEKAVGLYEAEDLQKIIDSGVYWE